MALALILPAVVTAAAVLTAFDVGALGYLFAGGRRGTVVAGR